MHSAATRERGVQGISSPHDLFVPLCSLCRLRILCDPEPSMDFVHETSARCSTSMVVPH